MSGDNDPYRERVSTGLLIGLIILSVIGMGLAAFTTSAVAQSQTIVVDAEGNGDYESIQNAIDNASQDDVIEVRAGTYDESVTIDVEGLTLEGAGNSAGGTVLQAPSSGSGNGITVDASDLTVRDLRITDYGNGIRMTNTHSNIVFDNVASVGNNNRGMELRNSADLTNLALNNVDFSNNNRGIRGATTSSVDGLTITDSEFSDNVQGITIFQSESDPGQLNDVTISDTEFNSNTQKAIYTEKLSNAILDNVTIDGITSDTYVVNTGIDINLKYDDYENITIRDSTVASVSEGDPLNGNPSASTAVAVKARGSSSDDSSSYTGTPATLDDVTIENVVIEDSFNGLRIGEFGVDYSGGGGPTDMTITDSTFQNNDRYHVEDLSNSVDLDTVQSDNTFDRAILSEVGIYSSIQAAVDTADSGDTIAVGSGTFDESVTIDVEGLTLEAADGASPTIIGQSSVAVESTTPNVEITGLTIENPNGDRGIRAQDNATGVVIQNNIVTNVNTENDANQARGILVLGLDGGDSADGLEIRNNTVTNIEGADADKEQVIAIQILETSNGGGLIENVVVDGNTVDDILDTRSTGAINFNGNIEGEITNNDISGLNTEGNPNNVNPGGGFTQVIALNAGGAASSGPQNVDVSGNEISEIETTTEENFFPPVGVIVSTGDASTITVTENNLELDTGVINRGSGTLDATNNWWGSATGPSGGTEDPSTGALANGDGSTVSENVEFSPWLDAPAPGGEPVQASGGSSNTGGDGSAAVETDESAGVSQTNVTLDNASAAENVSVSARAPSENENLPADQVATVVDITPRDSDGNVTNEPATIEFTIPQQRLTALGVTASELASPGAAEEVVIFREVDNGFEQLELTSSNVATDGGNAVVTFETPGFSEFVVGVGTGLGISTFEVANLNAPEEVTDGEPFEVGYTIENVGEEPTRKGVELIIDGEKIDTKPDTLTAGQSVSNSFTNVSLPSDVEPGDTVEVTVRTNDDTETQNLIVADADGSAGPPSVAEYANDQGIIDITGVSNAVSDWQAGEIGINLVSDIINAWQSGDPVE